MTNPADIATAVKPKKADVIKAVFTKGQVQSVKRLAAAKAAKSKAEEKIARYEAEVRAALGDATVGTSEDGLNVVKVMHSKNTRYDRNVLTTRFPDAAAASYVETPYSYLKTV